MEKILILDLGAKGAQLIARYVRECGVYSEIRPKHTSPEEIRAYKGVILAGKKALTDPEYDIDIPILKINSDIENNSHERKTIEDFVLKTCGIEPYWSTDTFIEQAIADIKSVAGTKKVLCALSGGVDSAVSAILTHRAVGKNLTCIFVDHGLMRKDEGNQVEAVFKEQLEINFIRCNSQDRFLKRLEGITDPEAKRKIIGEEFIRVFEEEAKKLGEIGYLVQGTIYPDIIESGIGSNALVKSHHNVGGLPEGIEFEGIIEPLKLLFKEEVRKCGLSLGIPEKLVCRQPFPGPGLGVRVIGEITAEKLDILREADAIYREEIEAASLNETINQYFAILTDMRSVGVAKGARTYDYTVALRGVTTNDFMSAKWAKIPYEVLEKVSGRIVNEVSKVTRVVYDITTKPPATIEWE